MSVQKARDTKRIKVAEDGSIDFEQADADWERNSNQRQRRTPKACRPTSSPAPPVGLPPEPGDATEVNEGDFLEAQRQHEWEKVWKERQARKVRLGELIERQRVMNEVGGLIVASKTKLRSIGSKIGPALAMEVEPAVCQSLVDAEVDEALADLAKWNLEA